jgi:sigma-B regulation protein RsbU (phosphoserine phosphatase)
VKLRTLLVISFLVIILLLGLGVAILQEVGMNRLARVHLDAAGGSIRETSQLSMKVARDAMTRQLENSLRRQVRALSEQVSILLSGRNTSSPDALRANAELVSLVQQEIRNVEDRLCGGFVLFGDSFQPVISGHLGTSEFQREAAPPDKKLELLAEAQSGLNSGLVEGRYRRSAGSEDRQVLLVARHVAGTALVLGAEVDTSLYVAPLENRLQTFAAEAVDNMQDQMERAVALSLLRMRVILLAGLGTLVLVTVFFMFRLVGAISRPLTRVQAAVERVASGHFDTHVPLMGTGEVRSLARTVNELGNRLAEYVDNLKQEVTAREAVEAELRAAGRIQRTLLPDEQPRLDAASIDLAGVNRATAEVGGDLYDYFELADGKVAVMIGDVSGKGMTAALFMSMARTVLRLSCGRCDEPAEALTEANRLLCGQNDTSLYVTIFLVYYDPATGQGRFANAGHIAPLLRRADGRSQWLEDPHGTVVGVVEEASYVSGGLQMDLGDTLLLYTDGVTEAKRRGEFYGSDRLEDLMGRIGPCSAHDLCLRIAEEVSTFQRDRLNDDVTLVALKRREVSDES